MLQVWIGATCIFRPILSLIQTSILLGPDVTSKARFGGGPSPSNWKTPLDSMDGYLLVVGYLPLSGVVRVQYGYMYLLEIGMPSRILGEVVQEVPLLSQKSQDLIVCRFLLAGGTTCPPLRWLVQV
ncbi:UNVERIFIED_CONTAM: hypothetical protein Sangu_1865600 [Sesamum angustifolium]|uniref:Uncharacterized protein n=1 Tax=Sesamum angustifolium TaxID=2727405 RepID=A0AAW2LW54_9LAMI